MPIKKETSARLVKEKVPYELISREVVQSITNPSALAIYTYLLTLPEHWIVRRAHLLDHFDGLGRDRYDSAMKQLYKLGVVWIMDSRNELGQIKDKVIVVETVPKVGKPTIRENPQVGKSDHIEIQTLPRDTNSRESNRGKQFSPPSIKDLLHYSAEKNYTGFDHETFFDFYESKGWMVGKNKMKDWKAAVRNWNKRNSNDNKQSGTNRKQYQSRPTAANAAQRLRDRISSNA